MERGTFHQLLENLECEYNRLQAEASALRGVVAACTPINGVIEPLGDYLTYSGVERPAAPERTHLSQQAACDVEVTFPDPVFQPDCVHHMSPVVPGTVPHRGSTVSAVTVTSTSSGSFASEGKQRRNTADAGPSARPSTRVVVVDKSCSTRGSQDSTSSSGQHHSGSLNPPDSEGHRSSKSSTASHSTRKPKTTQKIKISRQMFPDVEVVKSRVRQEVLNDQDYDVSNYYKPKGWAQALARHEHFEALTLLIIGLNSIWIAVETDYNDAELLKDADFGFQLIENLFCLYFSVEIVVRFVAFKHKSNCVRDLWFVFDSGLVVMMILETWVLFIVSMVTGFSMGNASILRIVRLVRLTRMARLTRLLRAVPELMILIKGVVAAARSVFFTLVLLIVLLYIFGIAFTQLLKSTDVGAQYFPSVIESMNTLWLYATLLNEITTIAKAIRADESGLYAMVLLDVFILAASLTVMNMLIGVLCEVVNSIATGEKEAASLSFAKQRIEAVFASLGIDPATDTICRAQFSNLIQDKEAAQALTELGVDVYQLLDMADFIFESDEIDPSSLAFSCLEKELTFEEFMNKVTDLRTSNVATVKDVMQLRKFIRQENCKALHHQESHLDRSMGDTLSATTSLLTRALTVPNTDSTQSSGSHLGTNPPPATPRRTKVGSIQSSRVSFSASTNPEVNPFSIPQSLDTNDDEDEDECVRNSVYVKDAGSPFAAS